jgi:membrane-associated phospholipid phosphatase
MITMHSRKPAELLTLIFNPPIVAAPTFVALILLQRPENSIALILITVSFGTLLPLAMVLVLSKRGVIPDVWASERETRVIPFAGAICSYLVGTVALVAARSPVSVMLLMLCYVGNTVIMMIISLRWKISIHASGIAGPATFLIYTLGFAAFPFLLLIVPVGWARLVLKAHTPWQVIAGALLTILTTWLQLRIYTPLI